MIASVLGNTLFLLTSSSNSIAFNILTLCLFTFNVLFSMLNIHGNILHCYLSIHVYTAFNYIKPHPLFPYSHWIFISSQLVPLSTLLHFFCVSQWVLVGTSKKNSHFHYNVYSSLFSKMGFHGGFFFVLFWFFLFVCFFPFLASVNFRGNSKLLLLSLAMCYCSEGLKPLVRNLEYKNCIRAK